MSKVLGIELTPPAIVAKMISLCPKLPPKSRILEVGCRNVPFLSAYAETYGYDFDFWGIEIDEEAAKDAQAKFPSANIVCGDFLLWESEPFHLIMGNPPYVVAGDFLPRQILYTYKARFSTWRGRFNLYAAFIEKGVRLLADGGYLVYIVPASWLIGDNFVNLRSFLAKSGSMDIYYVGDVFRNKISCVILVFKKGEMGMRLYDGDKLMVERSKYWGEPIRFETDEILEFERSGIPLGEMFLIRVAARSKEFRDSGLVSREPRDGLVPVLTGRNLKPKQIDYETCYSKMWMRKEDATRIRSFYAYPHIVVAHTHGNRIVAAYDSKAYPWREEYHLFPKEKLPFSVDELLDYLHSEQVQRYIKFVYRDFVPHVMKNMIEKIPLRLKCASLW